VPWKLEKTQVLFISLVKDPATGRQFLFKSGAGEPAFEHAIEFRKADDVRQVLYGIAYPAGDENNTDSHDDFAEAGEVTDMSYLFMCQGRSGIGVDRDHAYRTLDKVYVAESWIVRAGDPIFGNAEDIGGWAVGVKIVEKSLYDELKKTGYAGFSIAGTAERKEVKKAKGYESGWFDSIAKKLGIKKENAVDKELKEAIEKITDSVSGLQKDVDALKGKTPVQKTEIPGEIPGANDAIGKALETALAPVLKRLGDIEKAGQVDVKAEAVTALEKAIEGGDADEITKAMDALKKAEGDSGAETGGEEDAFTKAVKAMNDRLENLEKTKPGSAQVDPADTTNKSKGIGGIL